MLVGLLVIVIGIVQAGKLTFIQVIIGSAHVHVRVIADVFVGITVRLYDFFFIIGWRGRWRCCLLFFTLCHKVIF